jgi:hypothetical protein
VVLLEGAAWRLDRIKSAVEVTQAGIALHESQRDHPSIFISAFEPAPYIHRIEVGVLGELPRLSNQFVEKFGALRPRWLRLPDSSVGAGKPLEAACLFAKLKRGG